MMAIEFETADVEVETWELISIPVADAIRERLPVPVSSMAWKTQVNVAGKSGVMLLEAGVGPDTRTRLPELFTVISGTEGVVGNSVEPPAAVFRTNRVAVTVFPTSTEAGEMVNSPSSLPAFSRVKYRDV